MQVSMKDIVQHTFYARLWSAVAGTAQPRPYQEALPLSLVMRLAKYLPEKARKSDADTSSFVEMQLVGRCLEGLASFFLGPATP